MIRLLTQRDHDVVQSYLDKDPLHNIIMIHSLQTHGLESKRVTFWGAFNDDRLEGVFFVDNDSEPRFGCLAGDNPGVLARLGKLAPESEITTLIGKSTYIQPALKNLYSKVLIDVRRLNFVQVHPGQVVPRHDYPVRAATKEDIPLLIELYRDFEFSRKNRTDEEVEREIQRVMDDAGIYFFVELEGRAVSAARVALETDQAAAIDAVRTLPEFRGRGMYPSVRTACYEYLSKKGKIGVSYHRETNVSISRVLDKYGGDVTAKWLMIHLRNKPPLRRRILPRRLRRWGLRIKDRVLRQ